MIPACECGSRAAGLVWIPDKQYYQCGDCINKVYIALAEIKAQSATKLNVTDISLLVRVVADKLNATRLEGSTYRSPGLVAVGNLVLQCVLTKLHALNRE